MEVKYHFKLEMVEKGKKKKGFWGNMKLSFMKPKPFM